MQLIGKGPHSVYFDCVPMADCSMIITRYVKQQDFFFNNKIFIYSRPIAGIGAKMEHEQTYIQTYKMARETHL